ncbi:MAG: ABC transporter ATP-binding protein [Eubacteriaceae bacterium]
MQNECVVKMEKITKSFKNVKALDGVDFSLVKGEIHSLLGENGAGKSSLMNVLNGIYLQDVGEIEVKGKPVIVSSPSDALELGIGMLPQHFKLVDVFTAWENISAGNLKTDFFLSKKKIIKEIESLNDALGLEIDPMKKVYDMSIAEKQSLEIFKVLYRGADILILDEPTAVLTPQEIKRLFEIVKKMTERGCSVIIITHKLEEVMEISDRITIMRKGKAINTVNKNATNPQELAGMMVGDAMILNVPWVSVPQGKKALEVKNLSAVNSEKVPVLKEVSFDLYQGEILGVAGIAGSGQKELCEGIAGLFPMASGEITFEGENLIGKTPEKISQLGVRLSFVPEDRLGMGLVPSMDIVDNVLLKDYRNKKGIGMNRQLSKEKAKDLVSKLGIVTPSIENHPISHLSGGNIQKVLLGREIELAPKLIITAYATRGLDVGSSQLVYDLLNLEKKKMVPILYIGEDLDVLLNLCDRILVLFEGKVTGIVNAKEITKEEVGLLMSGVTKKGDGI